jgi:very-short-patch-repair endonuclease
MAADELCSAIAEKQFGLIERQQAVQAGMSRAAVGRRLASRRWVQVLPGVYRFAGVPTSWEQSLKAATLWGGERCVVSHETAASLHGLSLFGGRRVHVQSPRKLRRPNIAAHRTRFWGSRVVSVKGIPTTSVTRTIRDLSSSLPTKSLEKVLDEAIRRGMTDVARLKAELCRSGGNRRGTRTLRRLLKAREGDGGRTDSELEDELLRLIRRRRLPLPVVHYNVVHDEQWLGEIDLAYPQARIAIEVHGYGVHSLKRVWENDQRRENELVRAGWKLLKATNRQLEQDPDSFLEALRSLLEAAKTSHPRRARFKYGRNGRAASRELGSVV